MRAHGESAAERDAADRSFHIAIAVASGNEALAHTVGHLWDLRRGELWAKTEEHFHTRALREKTLADHEAIVSALAAHDARGARDAMRRHLSRVAQEFQRRIDDQPDARSGGTGRSAPGGKGGKWQGLESGTARDRRDNAIPTGQRGAQCAFTQTQFGGGRP